MLHKRLKKKNFYPLGPNRMTQLMEIAKHTQTLENVNTFSTLTVNETPHHT